MAFTHAWDNTQPPDTQAAKLLGQDIRDLKTDIQERLSQFWSGPVATRPTPEAAFGTANIGVLFFATDEGKTYRWTGAAWTLVNCNFTFSDLTIAAITGDNTERTANTITIPANYLTAGMWLSVYTLIDTGAAGNSTTKVYFGGTVLFSNIGAAPITFFVRADMFLTSVGAGGKYNIGGSQNGAFYGSAANQAVDTTASFIIKSTYLNNGSNGTSRGLIVRAWA